MKKLPTKNMKRKTKSLVNYILAISMAIGVIHNEGTFIGNAPSKPPVVQAKDINLESVSKNTFNIYGVGFGAIEESYISIPNYTNTSKYLNFENELKNDTAYSAILNDRRYENINIKNELIAERREYLLEQEREKIKPIICDTTDITKTSNMTKEQISHMLKDTWLEGEEDTLYNIEQNNGINIFFVYAVATLESGYGTSSRARNKNNFYGIEISKNFDSYKHNTEYFGSMMNRVYIDKGKININDIGQTYCPPNPNWGKLISQIMKEQYEKMTVLTVA